MRVGDTLAYLRGSWRLDRALDDRRSGLRGSFTGRALIAPPAAPRPGTPAGAALAACPAPPGTGTGTGPGPVLAYAESGELRFGGHAGPASRRLVLRGLPGGTVEVRFTDGRLFYLLDLRRGGWQAEHRCGDDVYLLEHRVLGAGRLEERWQVRGPAKDYAAITRLSRE